METTARSTGGVVVSTDPTYTFTVTGDRTLTAVFEQIPVYTITAAIDPEGSGTVTGAGRYQEGETVTLTAEPAGGYEFTGWQEGGQIVSESKTYSFTAEGDRALIVVCEKKVSRLPTGYTELEYIQSTGAQYIDTGFFDYSNKSIVSCVEFTAPGIDTQTIHSSQKKVTTSSTTRYYHITLFCSSDGKKIGMALNQNTSYMDEIAPSSKNVFKLSVSEGKLYANNKVALINIIPSYTEMNTMFIFASHRADNNAARDYSRMKLYGLDVIDESDGLYVRQFVPCSSPSGEIGLYDLAGKKFYGNLGSGTFTAGPAV